MGISAVIEEDEDGDKEVKQVAVAIDGRLWYYANVQPKQTQEIGIRFLTVLSAIRRAAAMCNKVYATREVVLTMFHDNEKSKYHWEVKTQKKADTISNIVSNASAISSKS